MGRYYNGAIEGKFWFGIQCSDDIENLITIKKNISYMWKGCGCYVENIKNNYCIDCYKSHTEHKTDIDSEENECLYLESDIFSYSLNKKLHYNELKKNMEALKLKITPNILNGFDKIEQNDKILNAYTGIFDKSLELLNNIENKKEMNELSVFVARYTLGYQLEYCMRTNTEDTFIVYCEY
jgi:hypothetical protein